MILRLLFWITTCVLVESTPSFQSIQNPFQESKDDTNIFHLLSDFSPQNLDNLEPDLPDPHIPRDPNPIDTPHSAGVLPGFFNDLILTIEKVSRIYDEEKSKVGGNRETGNLTTNVFSVLMTPKTISKVVDVTTTAEGEDEILEQLTAVILGAESRDGGHGHGLTLDPVTVIALLTLAAYLIRAVYQILIANTGRSYGSPSWMELAEMAQGVITLQNMFGNTENMINRIDASIAHKNSFMEVPGDLAAAGHLWMDDKEECLQKYFCQNLKGKTVSDFGLSELIMSLWSVFRGDFSVLKYMKRDAKSLDCTQITEVCEKDACKKCQDVDMTQAKQTKNMFKRGTQVIQMFIPMFKSIFTEKKS